MCHLEIRVETEGCERHDDIPSVADEGEHGARDVPDVEAEQPAPAAAVELHGLRLAAQHEEVVEEVEEEVAHHNRQSYLHRGNLCKI